MEEYPEITFLTIPPYSQLIQQPRRQHERSHSVLLFFVIALTRVSVTSESNPVYISGLGGQWFKLVTGKTRKKTIWQPGYPS